MKIFAKKALFGQKELPDAFSTITKIDACGETDVVCADNTIDYKAYHLCAYDPVLGVLLCVGNNVPAVVLANHWRNVVPVKKGVHWLDCHIFAGTSSFLLLSPDCLLLVDYKKRYSSSALYASFKNTALFSCIHVPQGVTWGVVGTRNGFAMFWKIVHDDNGAQLVWAALPINLQGLCGTFFFKDVIPSNGCIYAIDSNPNTPNNFIAVLSGAHGVCRWRLDEANLVSFYSAPRCETGAHIVSCRYTPGGVYVVATTSDLSVVLVWLEHGKKSNSKVVELLFFLEVGFGMRCCGANKVSEVGNLFFYSCGMHIARGGDLSTHVQCDKKSDMYLLLYSADDLVELLVKFEEKRLVHREDIFAQVAASRLDLWPTQDVNERFTMQRVIPCVSSGYWASTWKELDFELIIMTSNVYGPILIQRCRSKRSVEHVVELEDIHCATTLPPRMLLLSPPAEMLRSFWGNVMSEAAAATDPWRAVFRGVVNANLCGADRLTDAAFLGLLSFSLSRAVWLLPLSNECIEIPLNVVEQQCDWWTELFIEDSRQVVLLEKALPEPPQQTEVILRVISDPDKVIVYISHLFPSLMEPSICLTKSSLMPDLGSAGLENDDAALASMAILVDCRIERYGSALSEYRLFRNGCSLLLRLSDSSLVLVDLSGNNAAEDGVPAMVHYPLALFPANCSIVSYDTAWIPLRLSSVDPNGCDEGNMCLVLLCLLSERKGVVLWDMCRQRLLAYDQNVGCGEGEYKNVFAYSPRRCSLGGIGGDASKIVVRVLSNNSVVTTNTPAPSPVADFGSTTIERICGLFFLRDLLGRIMFTVNLGYCHDNSDAWWIKGNEDDAEWILLDLKDTQTPCFCLQIIEGQVLLVADREYFLGKTLVLSHRIAAVESGPSWPFGPLQANFFSALSTEENNEADEYEKKKEDRETDMLTGICEEQKHAFVLLCTNKEIWGFNLAQRVLNKANDAFWLLYQFSFERVVEQVMICSALQAVLVLTKDANKWRWLSLVHLNSAQLLAESRAMMYFAQEEGEGEVRIYPLHIEGGGLHVYLLGQCGVLGHVVFLPADLNRAHAYQEAQYFCAGVLNCAPAPSNFQEYQRFLPPRRTMKQEHNFFKRLMTLPWGEVMKNLEENVLRAEHMEPFDEFRRRIMADVHGDTQSLPKTALPSPPPPQEHEQQSQHPQQKEKVGNIAKGSRYTELKSVATREGISLEEARRLMNNNCVKLNERGERLAQLANKSKELAQEAATFNELARALREKQEKWWK